MEKDVLRALPRDMPLAKVNNRSYYDSMSAQEANLLVRRAQTRNHLLKMEVVAAKLGLNAHPNQTVLELGTGLGIHGVEVLDRGHHYVGLDISGGLLESAKKMHPQWREILAVQGDASRIPFQDALFDGVFCVATLHHLPTPAKGVREFLRILRPGGRFCILEPRRFYPTQFLQYIRHPRTEVSAMKMTPPNIRNWLAAAGQTQSTTTYHILTPNGNGAVSRFWDLCDTVLDAARLRPFVAVMLCVSGVKQEG